MVNKGLGDYTIPMANVFAADGDPKTLGEIYAYGFRNAHRLSWDLTDGTMFASDIGMDHIEEINIVRNGGNYGWMKREGFWENGRWRGGNLSQLFELPADILSGRQKDGLTYPVAIYDHDEGRAVTDGFTYHGVIPALRGKFVFGDIQAGRLFACDVAAMKSSGRRYSRDGGAGRRNPALRARRERQTGGRVAAGTRRADDGRQTPARRSAHRPQPRRRALHHVEAGRNDPDARARLGRVGQIAPLLESLAGGSRDERASPTFMIRPAIKERLHAFS